MPTGEKTNKQKNQTTRTKIIYYKNQEQKLELNKEQQYKQVTIVKLSN